MRKYSLSCFILSLEMLSGFAMPQDGISEFAYLQKAGDIDTGCLESLTVNNTITDRTVSPEKERTFLLELFHATGGPSHWTQKKGWAPNSDLHHCDWFGVKCYANNSYVKWIDLTENGLVGRPPNFWRFRNLQGMCFSRNIQLTGEISDLVAKNMTRLRRLCISFSGIYGRVPWNILLELYNLEKIQICCTRKYLTGTLPQDIGRLKKLQVFSIGETQIKDVDLPRSIKDLTKLWFLDLEYVKLKSGDLRYFSNMTQLQYLHLKNCGLKGTVPEDFAQTHPNIVELRLYGNNLEGELKSCFLGFKNITQLSLGLNPKLNGLLPAALGNLDSLQVLDLSRNNFTGFAKNMTFSKHLQTLYIGGNVNLKVEANHLIARLQPSKDTLRMLVASNCGLTGTLPPLFWSFKQIMYIDLSRNNMSGNIPSNALQSSVAYLFYLTLATNNFTGDIPISFFTPLNALTYLDLRGNPNLKGKYPFENMHFLEANFMETLTLNKDTLTCPTLRLTSSGGRADLDPDYYNYTQCYCNAGYYGFRKYCKHCMEGASCVVEEVPITEGQSAEREVKMIINKGYWPCCGNFTKVIRMVKCSQEKNFDDEICSPSGTCQCELRESNGRLQTSCNTSCICRYGNKGRLCSQCIEGYYKKGSLCIRCPEFRKNFPVVLTVCFVVCLLVSIILLACFRQSITYRRKFIVLILMFAVAISLMVLHYESIIPGWYFVIIFAVWILGLSGASDSLEGFLCIAVFFFQTLDAMLSDANIWPQTIVMLKYQITNAFNVEVSELTCNFSDASRPEVAFCVFLFLPIVAIFLIWLSYVFAKAVNAQRRLNVSITLCKRLTIQVLLFMYFPVTAKTFQAVLPCKQTDGMSYLKVAPWLDCAGTSYNWLLGLGFVSLVVFVIGVPFGVFSPMLYKYVGTNGEVADETHEWLKPLYEEFDQPYRRIFPLVFLSRRLLLAVLLTVVPPTSSYQVVGTTLLLVIFMLVTAICRPFRRYSDRFEFETLADVVVSVVLLLSFVGLAFLRVSHNFDESLLWFIISINGVVVLCCVVGMFVLFAINLCKSPDNEQPGHNVQGYEQIPG